MAHLHRLVSGTKFRQFVALALSVVLSLSSITPSFAASSLWQQRKTSQKTQEARNQILKNHQTLTQLANAKLYSPAFPSAIKTNNSLESNLTALLADPKNQKILQEQSLGIPVALWQELAPYASIENVWLQQPLRLNAQGNIQFTQPTVLLIQDVHQQSNVQSNIEALIRNLTAKGVSLVGVEGSKQAMQALEIWRNAPEQHTVAQAAHYFARKGFLTGVECSAFNNSHPQTVYWGVEKTQPYLAQVQTIYDLQTPQKNLAVWQTQFAQALNKVNTAELTAPQKKFIDGFAQFEAGTLALTDWAGILHQTSAQTLAALPNLQKFYRAATLEKNLDLPALQKEQNQLLQTLAEKMTPQELKNLLEVSLLYRLGARHSSDFYTALKAAAQKHQLAFSKNLEVYLTYASYFDGIDRIAFYKELAQAVPQTIGALSISKTAREVLNLNADFALAQKAIALELTPQDWDTFQTRQSAIANLPARIGKFNQQISAPKELAQALSLSHQFSALSDQRSHIFVQNLQQKMQTEKLSGAILVAGGFHTEKIQEALRAQGIGYITLQPKFKSNAEKSHPLQTFVREKLPLEKAFAPQKITIAPQQVLGGVGPVDTGIESALAHMALASAKDRQALQQYLARNGRHVGAITDLGDSTVQVGSYVFQFTEKGAESKAPATLAVKPGETPLQLIDQGDFENGVHAAIYAPVPQESSENIKRSLTAGARELFLRLSLFSAITALKSIAEKFSISGRDSFEKEYLERLQKQVAQLDQAIQNQNNPQFPNLNVILQARRQALQQLNNNPADETAKTQIVQMDAFISKQVDELNVHAIQQKEYSALPADKAPQKVFSDFIGDAALLKEWREKAAAALAQGQFAVVKFAGGAATRLGIGAMWSLDPQEVGAAIYKNSTEPKKMSLKEKEIYSIFRKYVGENINLLRAELAATKDPAKIEKIRQKILEFETLESKINQQYRQIRKESVTGNLLGRSLNRLRYQYEQVVIDAKEFNLPLVIAVPQEELEGIVAHFKAQGFYGFDQSKVYFLAQKKYPVYSLDEKGNLKSQNNTLPLGHGDVLQLMYEDGAAYQVNKDGKIESQQGSLDHILDLAGVKAALARRINDLTVSEGEGLHLDELAFTLYQMEQNNAGMVVPLVGNPENQKGGTALLDIKTGKAVMFEKLNYSGTLGKATKAAVESQENAPYNQFSWAFNLRKARQALAHHPLDENLRYKDGAFTVETVSGDLTFKPGMDAVFYQRLPIIRDLKEFKNLPMALEMVVKQSKDENFQRFLWLQKARAVLKQQETPWRNGYDIRGVAYDEKNPSKVTMTPDLTYLAGVSLALQLKEDYAQDYEQGAIRVLVTADMFRPSAKGLMSEFVQGLVEQGINVDFTYELFSTEDANLVVRAQKYHMGVQITASHNPINENGFKVNYRNPKTGYIHGIFGNALVDILMRGHAAVAALPKNQWGKNGDNGKLRIAEEIKQAQFQYWLKIFGLDHSDLSDFRVVFDPGNGVGGSRPGDTEGVKKVFEQLGLESNYIGLHDEVIDSYDAARIAESKHGMHVADPSKTPDYEHLRAEVAKLQDADQQHIYIGAAGDGDMDRFGFVDEGGKRYFTPAELMVLAYSIEIELAAKENRASRFVLDLRTSETVIDYLAQRKGQSAYDFLSDEKNVVWHAPGWPIVRQLLRENGARMGIEASHHWMLPAFADPDEDLIDGASRATLLTLVFAAHLKKNGLLVKGKTVHSIRDLVDQFELKKTFKEEFRPDVLEEYPGQRYAILPDISDQVRDLTLRAIPGAKVLIWGSPTGKDKDGVATFERGARRLQIFDPSGKFISWIVTRASNTSAKLSVVVETETETYRSIIASALKDSMQTAARKARFKENQVAELSQYLIEGEAAAVSAMHSFSDIATYLKNLTAALVRAGTAIASTVTASLHSVLSLVHNSSTNLREAGQLEDLEKIFNLTVDKNVITVAGVRITVSIGKLPKGVSAAQPGGRVYATSQRNPDGSWNVIVQEETKNDGLLLRAVAEEILEAVLMNQLLVQGLSFDQAQTAAKDLGRRFAAAFAEKPEPARSVEGIQSALNAVQDALPAGLLLNETPQTEALRALRIANQTYTQASATAIEKAISEESKAEATMESLESLLELWGALHELDVEKRSQVTPVIQEALAKFFHDPNLTLVIPVEKLTTQLDPNAAVDFGTTRLEKIDRLMQAFQRGRAQALQNKQWVRQQNIDPDTAVKKNSAEAPAIYVATGLLVNPSADEKQESKNAALTQLTHLIRTRLESGKDVYIASSAGTQEEVIEALRSHLGDLNRYGNKIHILVEEVLNVDQLQQDWKIEGATVFTDSFDRVSHSIASKATLIEITAEGTFHVVQGLGAIEAELQTILEIRTNA